MCPILCSLHPPLLPPHWQTKSTVAVFFLLLSFYWTMEVIRNIVHVTTAGTVATYYFQRLSMPPNVTGRAFWRSVTTSFGSICLGSFFVAFIQALRGVVSFFRGRGAMGC